MTATPALTGALAEHPALSQWVAFPAPGKVTIFSGKVEIGQGVLTAMVQLAAEELDVAASRIAIESGDTDLTPNEGFTAGSQSMQFGGVALRQACAEVRAAFLRHAARKLGCDAAGLSVADGRILRNGSATGEDYWTLASAVSLDAKATGGAARKPAAAYTVVGQNAARLDLPAKVFGAPAFIHDMRLDGMRHARVVRQPRRAASIDTVDEAAIRRAARGGIDLVRHGDFLAIVGSDETAVEAAAVAAETHVTWQGVEPLNPMQQQASSLLQQPTHRPHGRAARRGGARRRTSRGDLFARLPGACLDRAVMRARRISRRASDGVDACAGRVSAARRAGAIARARCEERVGAPRAGPRLLRPQRRRRRRGRRGGHRNADAGQADPGAVAARGGVLLRAGEPRHGGEGARRARRRRASRRLDRGDLERHAQRAAGQRQPARRAGAAEPAARAGAAGRARRRRRRRGAQRDAALRHPGQAVHPPSGAGDAAAHLGAARARRHAERVRDRMLHRRIGRARRPGPGAVPARHHVRSARAAP